MFHSPIPAIAAPASDLPHPFRPRHEATLAGSFHLTGRGLHTGRRGGALVQPAQSGGVVFRRRIRGEPIAVEALWRNTTPQPLCTALRMPGGHLARTIEHLAAALYTHAIDHAVIDLDDEELPIFDGSAVPWCEAIARVGRCELPTRRRYLRVLKTVSHEEGKHRLRIEPGDRFSVDVRIALAHFPPMAWAGEVTPQAMVRDIAPSRSFGRLKWALPSKIYGFVTRRPLLRGANLRSTAAIVGGRVIGGMRVPDEPVRHRVLDLVGDLALAGYPIIGHVVAESPGHDPNNRLLRALMNQPDAWRIEEA